MKAISLFLKALIMAGLVNVTSQAYASDVKITFRFFDEAGRELGPRHITRRMTNGNNKNILSSGVFDLDTLKAVKLNPSLPIQGPWTITFSDLDELPRQGLMVHWNTTSTGYSTFLLDHE